MIIMISECTVCKLKKTPNEINFHVLSEMNYNWNTFLHLKNCEYL